MRRQVRRGFTIVELLVSLSIAAILLTLVYQVFISQRRTYTAQEEVAEMQQNARIGLETLTRDLQNIGAGVDRGDPQLLHCAPYEIVFYADLDLDQDGVTGPASPSIAITLLSPSGGSVTTPATAPGSATAETYQIALRANAGGTYDLVREKRWGGNSVISEVVLDLNITTDGTDTVPLFRYWGDFDPADDAPDLWGDSDGDNDLSAAEIALLTPVTPGAGQTLEDIVQRVEVQLVAETRNPDQLTGGKRRNVLRSNVVPRNLWPCPAFGMAPVVPPLTVDDLFSATPTTAVDFAVTYQNQPDIDRRVFFTLANTNAPVVDSTSTAISPVFTVAPDGIATTTITWAAACAAVAAHFNGGGGSLTYDLTATLAPFVSPFGTCPASSQTVPITVGPGVADRIEVVIASDQVSTCGAQDGFEFTATGWDDMGACPTASSIQVPPVPPVDFDALTNGGGTGAITDNGVLDLASETFTVTRPTGGNYGALSGDYFPFYLTATPTSPPDITYTGGARPFPPATDANAVDILPWPPFKLEWTPSAILGPFEDCDEITYSDSFRVQDCYTNYVFNDLAPKPAGFTEDNYQVIAALVPDPNPNAPADQGGISSNPGFPTPAATVTITKPVGGTPPEYDVSYTTPVCSLDPSRVPAGINPEIELTLSGDDTPGFGPPVSPAPDAMQLDSCLDSCAIEASIDGGITWQNPLVITECDTPTTAIIRINSCNLDGKDVELVLTATGGTAQFVGGTSPTTATVALLGSSPSQGTAEVEILTATHGAQFSIEAFYPAQTGAVWSCGPLTIEVQNECTDIAAYYYDEHGMRYDLGPSASTRPCVAEIDDLYFEVDDCRLNSGRVYADIGTSKGLIVKVYAGGILYDQEEVDLDPNATLQTLTEVAPLHVAMQDGGPFVAIGPDKELNYPPGSIVTFEIQYTDPDDPSDDGCTLTERMPPPLPVCFPNAITSGGGAGWNGNFNVHWGDAVVRGNISLPSAFISKEDPAVAPINGASFAGKSSLKDQFVDIYVGKQLPFDPLTGNFTGEPNPDPATMDQPFIGKGYGNYFRNISYDKITDMIVEIDYETMKFLAQGRNVYWYTLPSGDVRNPVTGAIADLQTVLHMAGPGKPNAYHDGSFIFIDAVGTAAAAPIYTGADIDSMAMLGALPAHAISGTFFTEGIVYVAGTLNFGGLGIRTAVDVWTPPRRELHYDHNDPAWFTSADQLPIRSDVGQSQIFIPATDPDAVKVHINGAIYVDGEVSGSGSPAVFGSVTAEQGYTGSGTPEIWYNYNLNVSGFSESLCVDCCTLSLSPTTATVSPGETVNLTALNASGVVEWKIVRMIPAVAGTTVGTLASAVGWTNKVTAGDYGTMMIRARDPNNCTATVTISVVDPCTRFGVWGNLTPTWSVVDPGDWETFSVGYAPSGAVNWNVTGWPPAGTSAVYPATGDVVVTGLCPGSSASIEATDPLCPGVTLWSNLWVDFPPGWSCGMHLGSKPANIEVGKTFTFEVKDSSCNSPQLWISASDGTDGNTFGTFTWDPVIDPTRADFTATTDSGTTTLTVYAWEAGGCFDSATFTVSSACPTVVIDQTPAGSPLTVGTLYTYQASGGTAPYTFALDAARSTALGTVTSAGADTATFTATTPGSVVITVTDPTGCISELSLWADCPWPTVTTVAPDDGDTYGSLTSNGTSLVWQADPDDHDAGGPTNNIARVEFFAWDQSWNLRYSFTDNQVQYCGFGTDACSANPGNISGWPDGTYHLLSTAYTLNRTGCGVAASSDQVDITVYNTSCPISIDPPGPRTQKKSTTVTLTASGHVGTVNWSSSDISLATVSPASGNSTTVTLQNKPNSTVFIRAEDDRCFVEYKINIIP